MLPIWENLREVYVPGQMKLDAGKVSNFCKYMESYFHPTVCKTLMDAIVDGPVGMDDEQKEGEYRGTFPKRIQQWLLKNYDIQINDKSNIINDLLGKLNKNMVNEPLYALFSKKIEWTAGDFGDPGSCYWGCNAITRYFLSNWNCFRAMKFYTKHEKMTKVEYEKSYKKATKFIWQDGYVYKGYGRVLTSVDFPQENLFLMWNAYPSGELVSLYMQAYLNGVRQENTELADKLKNRQVAFVNQGSGGGWFYTNNRQCMIVGEKADLDKIGGTVDLGYQGTPDKTKLNEYVGECIHCHKRGVWSDRPSLDGKVCEYCITNHQVCCGITKKYGFGPAKDLYEVMELPSSFKLVTEIVTGRNLWVCPEEFEKLDDKKYTSQVKRKGKKLEPALVAAMPDMMDDLDEEDLEYNEDYDEEYDDD